MYDVGMRCGKWEKKKTYPSGRNPIGIMLASHSKPTHGALILSGCSSFLLSFQHENVWVKVQASQESVVK